MQVRNFEPDYAKCYTASEAVPHEFRVCISTQLTPGHQAPHFGVVLGLATEGRDKYSGGVE